MDDVKVEKIRLEDGRHAERHVRDSGDEVVVELHIEPERELKLSQRIIEKKKPVVFERAVEKYNNSGEVVERKVEALDAEPKLEMHSKLERLKTSHERLADERAENDPKRFVTRDELKDAFVAAVNVMQEKKPVVRKMTATQAVENRMKASQEKPSWKVIAFVALLVVQAAALAYIMFWM